MDEEQLVKDPWSMTLLEFVRMGKEFNAGITQMSATRGDEPFVSVICVRGQEECAEIAAAIATVERRWDLRRELARQEQDKCSE